MGEIFNRCKISNHGRHELHSHIVPGLYVQFDPVSLTSVLNNLIENAEKYSPAHSKINIELAPHENEGLVSLRVCDEGMGISKEDKENIFQKFYRVGNEETRSTKGTGLGLYIVKNIVNSQGGEITVKNNSPKGSIFEIILKRESPAVV